jgi:hypothetical protein
VEPPVGFSFRSFRYLQKFRGHAGPGQGLGHVSLLKFVNHTGCLCSAGSGGHPLPGVVARTQPSDSPAASAGTLVPLARGLPRVRTLF